MCVRVRLLSFRLALRVWIIQSRSDIRPTSIAVNYSGTPDNMVSRWSLTGVLSFMNCFIKEFVHVMHINIYWGNTLISLHYCPSLFLPDLFMLLLWYFSDSQWEIKTSSFPSSLYVSKSHSVSHVFFSKCPNWASYILYSIKLLNFEW